MDIWIWIAIFIVAWLLEALSSAAKKRREAPPRRVPSSPPPSPRPAPQPEVERITFEVPVPRPSRAPREARIPRPREWEPAESLEGVSAEVERAAPQPEPTVVEHLGLRHRELVAGEIGAPSRPRAPRRFSFHPRRLRDAIVLMELLGPPKSER